MFSEDSFMIHLSDLNDDTVLLQRDYRAGPRSAVMLHPPSPSSPRDWVLTWPPVFHDVLPPTPTTASSVYYTPPSSPMLEPASPTLSETSSAPSEGSDSWFIGSSSSGTTYSDTNSTSSTPPTTPIIAPLPFIPFVAGWPAGHPELLLDILLGRSPGKAAIQPPRLKGLARLRRIAPPPICTQA
ncbi:hypothetical protein HMN09_00181000 [Mycena chlorophos]|uniref:Uncharacterized protein n=1 Tax=Mycena chlorophos TaxID=658473 RepID=A0A8H6WN72_MYCCL|nr:hypothetical protein HMN09_00181000 [Mycena chlorophos]